MQISLNTHLCNFKRHSEALAEESQIQPYFAKNLRMSSDNLSPLKKDTVTLAFKGTKTDETIGKINAAKAEIADLKRKKDYDGILNKFGIKVTYEDNKRVLSEYKQPDKDFSWSDLGIKENDLIKDIVKIKGNADFTNSQATDLSNLKSIGVTAHFENSKVTDLSSLKYIGASGYFENSQITDMRNLESIGWNAHFENSQVTVLNSLEYIGFNAYFTNSKVTNLNSLQSINGSAYFENSQITDLHSLRYISKHAYFTNSNVTDLSRLQYIGNNAYFEHSKIESLPSLTIIGHNVFIADSLLKPEQFKNVKVRGRVYSKNIFKK